MAEQKMVGALGHWVAGGIPSASAKRSVEQKCGIKIGRTKIGRTKIWWGTHGGNKKWWGPSAIGWQGGPLVQVQKGQQNKNAE